MKELRSANLRSRLAEKGTTRQGTCMGKFAA
eukprot:CAMPEP_0184386248 /NCGR_PEP_ID=MMETSP0007-20130409/9629_1 /TAXON_ID=97485 /ORGANISM="Prymnesium parvum, Strain Texoma1" /LENGTH=30 /DNA_ID= /DNA_START= /DNA_END= /DNA_ORIENTATION=